MKYMKKGRDHFLFLDKSLFFPEKGILVIGDLHLGYDYMLQEAGFLAPQEQIKEVKKEIKNIIEQIIKSGKLLKKIVFIGDIKHSFSYNKKEKSYFKEIYLFLQKYVNEKDILLVKGNHDTIDYSYGDKLRDYFIIGDIAFTHGHKMIEEVFNKKIKIIIIGHLHPSVILSEKKGVKREKYKCFLVGKFKNKKIIVMPSFLSTIEGTTVNNLKEDYEDYFSFIPKKALSKFKVFIIGENETYDFGVLNKIQIKD